MYGFGSDILADAAFAGDKREDIELGYGKQIFEENFQGGTAFQQAETALFFKKICLISGIPEQVDEGACDSLEDQAVPSGELVAFFRKDMKHEGKFFCVGSGDADAAVRTDFEKILGQHGVVAVQQAWLRHVGKPCFPFFSKNKPLIGREKMRGLFFALPVFGELDPPHAVAKLDGRRYGEQGEIGRDDPAVGGGHFVYSGFFIGLNKEFRLPAQDGRFHVGEAHVRVRYGGICYHNEAPGLNMQCGSCPHGMHKSMRSTV